MTWKLKTFSIGFLLFLIIDHIEEAFNQHRLHAFVLFFFCTLFYANYKQQLIELEKNMLVIEHTSAITTKQLFPAKQKIKNDRICRK